MSKLEALVSGGLRQNAIGEWVNGNGEPVNVAQLPADVRAKIGLKPEPKPVAPKQTRKAKRQ